MDERFSLRILEYESARRLVARFLSSPLGGERLAEMAPSSDPVTVAASLAEVHECRRALDEHGAPPLDGLVPLATVLRHARIPRATLPPEDLLKVLRVLIVCRRTADWLSRARSIGAHLADYAGAIIPFPEIEGMLQKSLDEDGHVKDDASRELARIRKAIRSLQDDINRRLLRLSRGALKEYLQEDYITQRNGRYVVAVASKWKNQVKGIIHDRSETGATTYIEPITVVESGNRLQDEQAEEEQEIRRILQHLTGQVARAGEPLVWAVDALRDLDFANAKARFAIHFRCQPPEVSTDGRLRMVQGRHPLLIDILGDKVVPTTCEVNPEKRTVVITGPNTGGKTVVLKTVGLLCLLYQSGLEIPCGDGTMLPVFEEIRADIGDEQSLEQSLSTFSSHIGHIRDILAAARAGVLVLLDELGAGTDPIEGGALGVAIAEHLVRSGAYTLLTTHLHDLKLLAHDHPNMVNAAMLFDEETLGPTYEMRMGRAGRSNALSIARRLGIPGPVVDRAEEQLSGESPEASQLLMRLEGEVAAAERDRQEAESERASASRLYQETLAELRRAQKDRAEAGQRAKTAAEAMLSELRDKSRALSRRLRRAGESLDAAERARLTREVVETEAVIEEVAHHPDLAREEEEVPVRLVEPGDLHIGQHVKLEGFSGVAEIQALDMKKEQIAVSISDMHLRVPMAQVLGIVDNYKEKPRKEAPISYRPVELESPSLDVIGLTVEEMRPKVQKFVDDAYLSRMPQVWIIHGFGSGTLKRAVRDLLLSHPLVKRFRNGTEIEGGAAVTVVTFKDN